MILLSRGFGRVKKEYETLVPLLFLARFRAMLEIGRKKERERELASFLSFFTAVVLKYGYCGTT